MIDFFRKFGINDYEIKKGYILTKQVKPLTFYIVFGSTSEADIIHRLGHNVTDDIRSADALLLTGGGDIPTSLYGQVNVASGNSPKHDEADYSAMNYWEQNKSQFRMLVGICRGAQWLNCVSGGSMWQDVDGHIGNHFVKDLRSNYMYECNSVHHQMMRPSPDAEIIAVAPLPLTTRLVDDTGTYKPEVGMQDIEVLWYDSTNSLCFQAHPEYGHRSTTDYFNILFNEKFKHILAKEGS